VPASQRQLVANAGALVAGARRHTVRDPRIPTLGTRAATLTSMRTAGIGAALLVSIVLLLVVWAVGRVAGYEISLMSSLGMTVVLTIVLNLVLGALSRRRRRF
jgi:hypothetical protein